MADGGRREDRRTGILHAVWAVIARMGIAGVSIRSVAAEAGVSAGRVQHHFPTKGALVRASVAEMIDSAESAHVEEVAGADPETELWHVLAHALPDEAASRAGTSVFYSYVAAAVADPEIARLLAEAKDGVEDEVARLLAACGVETADPAADARALLAVADGLTLRVFVGGLSAADAKASLRGALDSALGRASAPRPGAGSA